MNNNLNHSLNLFHLSHMWLTVVQSISLLHLYFISKCQVVQKGKPYLICSPAQAQAQAQTQRSLILNKRGLTRDTTSGLRDQLIIP
jgi:hypothetical protein